MGEKESTKMLKLSTLKDLAQRGMTLSIWLRLEEKIPCTGRNTRNWGVSYWDLLSSVVIVHLKLTAGIQPRVSGASAGNITWGLIAAEMKNWLRIFIALLIKRKRGHLGKFVPPPKIMHMKTHWHIQLFCLLYFTNIIQRHTNWFSKYSDQKKLIPETIVNISFILMVLIFLLTILCDRLLVWIETPSILAVIARHL